MENKYLLIYTEPDNFVFTMNVPKTQFQEFKTLEDIDAFIENRSNAILPSIIYKISGTLDIVHTVEYITEETQRSKTSYRIEDGNN